MISFLSQSSFACQCLAFSIVACLGLSFGSLLKIIFNSKKESPSKGLFSNRFISICILLTFAVVFYSLLIFACHSLTFFVGFYKSHSNYIPLLSAIFLFSVFLSFFWKIMLPLTLLLYAGFSLATFHLLKTKFPSQNRNIEVLVNQKEICLNKEKFSSNNKNLLRIDSYCLSDLLPLPLPRNWFLISLLDDMGDPQEEKVVDDSFFYQESDAFTKWCFKILFDKSQAQFKELPLNEEKNYPSLYSLKISFKKGSLNAELIGEL